MLRARRFASVAVVAALGLTALTGCRSDPSVAAYVGDSRISTDRVAAVYADARTKLTKAVEDYRAGQQKGPQASPSATPEPIEMPITESDVAALLVGRDVLRRIAQERGAERADVSMDEIEQEVQLPRDTEYAQEFAEFRSYLIGLVQTLEQPEPVTEADLKEIYGRVQRGGGNPNLGGTYAEFVQRLDEQSRETLARALAIRDLFDAKVEQLNAVVNPRYVPAEMPLLQTSNASGEPLELVVLTLSVAGAAPPVVEAG